MSTDNKLAQYIDKRAKLLTGWRSEPVRMKDLAEQWIYIRVGGDKYRPVSIHPDNPCGCLKRLNGRESEIGSNESLEEALKDAETAAAANTKKPGNKKPEHVVQAGLIHHALMHDMRLDGRLNGFLSHFDELIFITDELKAGEIRADIIALGGKDGKYFPVFIELKGIRSFKRVLAQLIHAQQEMATVKGNFIEMLVKGTGKTADSISFDDYKLFVIWPAAPSGRGNASAAKAVAEEGCVAACEHLLIGEFKIPVVPRDGFDSVVKFGQSA